ncbi:MAG TPA: DUF4058 family protein, partial [Planctomycetia bacterium]|nr:DUF4058 family protein [Planctomycetia bacterium]
MPLRDHFHPPLSDHRPWDALHGLWPGLIAVRLNEIMPERFFAGPNVRIGGGYEVDVGAIDERPGDAEFARATTGSGASAAALWAPPSPLVAALAEAPEFDEYEVQIREGSLRGRLVAAIELPSPGNKDRPETRNAFVGKCAEMLNAGVAVVIVDVVTERRFNLYAQLMEFIGQEDSAGSEGNSQIYAAACRYVPATKGMRRFESWPHALEIGKALPTLPL